MTDDVYDAGNFSLSVIPMLILGTLNLAYWLFFTFWSFLVVLGLCEPWPRVIEPKRIMEQMQSKPGAGVDKEKDQIY